MRYLRADCGATRLLRLTNPRRARSSPQIPNLETRPSTRRREGCPDSLRSPAESTEPTQKPTKFLLLTGPSSGPSALQPDVPASVAGHPLLGLLHLLAEHGGATLRIENRDHGVDLGHYLAGPPLLL